MAAAVGDGVGLEATEPPTVWSGVGVGSNLDVVLSSWDGSSEMDTWESISAGSCTMLS